MVKSFDFFIAIREMLFGFNFKLKIWVFMISNICVSMESCTRFLSH